MYDYSVVICILMCLVFILGALFVEVWNNRKERKEWFTYYDPYRNIYRDVQRSSQAHIRQLTEDVQFLKARLKHTSEALEKATHTRDDYR
jgi:FtsZ-interacting cell division protein ZipA